MMEGSSYSLATINIQTSMKIIEKKNQKFEASSIPPHKSELYQQLLRAHYISSIWRNAYKKQLTTLDPLEYGWIEQDNIYAFKGFEGDQLPYFVSDLITNVPGKLITILSRTCSDEFTFILQFMFYFCSIRFNG
ncbi:hypothetical protein F3H15_34595 [Pseudomonas aeruginosa]|nr:hypothetical protein F3H15_34595 [Pseudomonas aeruginosa]